MHVFRWREKPCDGLIHMSTRTLTLEFIKIKFTFDSAAWIPPTNIQRGELWSPIAPRAAPGLPWLPDSCQGRCVGTGRL